jgi:glyoxylase-like metal-dependent hydrolase (beta-lactamase superfamily II)
MSGTDDVLTVAERLWAGTPTTDGSGINPMAPGGGLAEVADGVAFVPSFANVAAVRTGDGLVLVDVGSPFLSGEVHRTLRTWTDQQLHSAIYSHGHIDHVFGVHRWEADAEASGSPAPQVVAHEAVAARFDRYVTTAGYNSIVNRRQFGIDELEWPTRYRYPDRTFRDRLDLDIGGVTAQLHHARGETDDHAWTWFPDRRVLCTGDLFIWASPNAGNPQKVQRFPLEWAQALRRMVDLYDSPGGGPEVLLPGHGYPIIGADRIRRALSETAELLESLVEQTLALMNSGARLDEAIHTVVAPTHLADRPYLQPIYDEPEFVVRGVWRLYGGW